jgi:DNA-binding GntR family transcriptional regulator
LSVRKKLFVPPVVLSRDSLVPLHTQIYRQVAQAIRSGAIHSNARLPSSRTLARLLQVSRNTVLSAYEQLVAYGHLRGERGAAMYVCSRMPAEPSWFSLRRAIRAASYPARVHTLADPDGNPLYIVAS